MAYLALSETMTAPSAPAPLFLPSPKSTAATEVASFSVVEWSVIRLARLDRRSSLRPPSRWLAALAALVGERLDRHLADPRLEALRQMAVLTWHHGYSVTTAQIRAFFDAGYSADHYDLLGRHISHARNAPYYRSARA